MFEAVTSYADFKRNMLAISNVAEEASLTADSDGIAFNGMDPSHVSLVLVKWPAGDFESYECDGKTEITVRMNELVKIVKRFSKQSDIQILVGETHMTLKSGNTTFKVRLLEVGCSGNKIPNVATDVEFDMDAKSLHTLLKDVEVASDYAEFRTDETSFSLHGKGDSGEVDIDADEGITFGKSYDGSTSCKYSIEYLIPFMTDLEGDVSVRFADKKPLIMTCGHVTFMVAPRV